MDSQEQEEEQHFEVEKILDHKQLKGKNWTKIYYLIKWKNYSVKESTWEEESNFESVENDIEFLKMVNAYFKE